MNIIFHCPFARNGNNSDVKDSLKRDIKLHQNRLCNQKAASGQRTLTSQKSEPTLKI